jgi:hypothetical protein
MLTLSRRFEPFVKTGRGSMENRLTGLDFRFRDGMTFRVMSPRQPNASRLRRSSRLHSHAPATLFYASGSSAKRKPVNTLAKNGTVNPAQVS